LKDKKEDCRGTKTGIASATKAVASQRQKGCRFTAITKCQGNERKDEEIAFVNLLST